MSQKNWAKYFLAQGTPENVEVGWVPAGEQSGRSSPTESLAKFEELAGESPASSPKSGSNIVAASYKAAGKGRKRRSRKNRKTRRNRRTSRR